MSIMSILVFILCAYGLTQILVFSSIFEPYRPSHHFFHCPMCIGFWVGVLLVLLNPFTELFISWVVCLPALLMRYVC